MLLQSEHISKNSNAKILVVFGGNKERRNEIIHLLMPIENLTIYGTLSEQEGLDKIKALAKVDIVLIGGRYSVEQRHNIKSIINSNYSHILITEPGVEYTYSNETIFNHINNIIKNETTSKI